MFLEIDLAFESCNLFLWEWYWGKVLDLHHCRRQKKHNLQLNNTIVTHKANSLLSVLGNLNYTIVFIVTES